MILLHLTTNAFTITALYLLLFDMANYIKPGKECMTYVQDMQRLPRVLAVYESLEFIS